MTATVEFLNYTLQKADEYKREAENLTNSIKEFKRFLKTDRKKFKDDSQLLEKVETMAQQEMDKLVIRAGSGRIF